MGVAVDVGALKVRVGCKVSAGDPQAETSIHELINRRKRVFLKFMIGLLLHEYSAKCKPLNKKDQSMAPWSF